MPLSIEELERRMQEERKEFEQFSMLMHGKEIGLDWVPADLFCRHCQAQLMTEDEVASLAGDSTQKLYDRQDLTAQHFFDLRRHMRIANADWISEQTDLWAYGGNETDPWEITERHTVKGPYGGGSVYRRACDKLAFVFVRSCRVCEGSDPLDLGTYLSDIGLSYRPGPHTFLSVMKKEKAAEKERIEDAKAAEYAEFEKTRSKMKAAAAKSLEGHEQKASLEEVTYKTCRACEQSVRADARYCKLCGSKQSD